MGTVLSWSRCLLSRVRVRERLRPPKLGGGGHWGEQETLRKDAECVDLASNMLGITATLAFAPCCLVPPLPPDVHMHTRMHTRAREPKRKRHHKHSFSCLLPLTTACPQS